MDMDMLQNETIVILSDVDWEGHWVCEQQIASLLSQQNKVLYVEQTRTLLSFIYKSGGDTPPLAKFKLFAKGLQNRSKNLITVCPPLILPFKYLPIVYQFNQSMRLLWLKRQIQTVGFNNPIVIMFDPDSGALIGRLGEQLSIFYRNDNHDKRGLWFNTDRLVKKREAQLMKKVDFVCALTNGLALKARECNANVNVIPNGVNLELFSVDGGEPGDISEIPHPRIGIVGMLDWRIDVDLIEALANNHQEWSFVFVGPVNSADHKMYKKLRRMANVHFLGSKSVKDIPRYMKAVDVGLIPYKLNEYTRDILSLKLFEYSASSIPTVATPMPELFSYSEFIHIADGQREFEDCISASLNSCDSVKSQKLFEFAKLNTWLARVEQLSQIIHLVEKKAHRGLT